MRFGNGRRGNILLEVAIENLIAQNRQINQSQISNHRKGPLPHRNELRPLNQHKQNQNGKQTPEPRSRTTEEQVR